MRGATLTYIPINGNPAVSRRQKAETKKKKGKAIIAALYVVGAVFIAIVATRAVITSTAKASISLETGAIVMEIGGHSYEYYEQTATYQN